MHASLTATRDLSANTGTARYQTRSTPQDCKFPQSPAQSLRVKKRNFSERSFRVPVPATQSLPRGPQLIVRVPVAAPGHPKVIPAELYKCWNVQCAIPCAIPCFPLGRQKTTVGAVRRSHDAWTRPWYRKHIHGVAQYRSPLKPSSPGAQAGLLCATQCLARTMA